VATLDALPSRPRVAVAFIQLYAGIPRYHNPLLLILGDVNLRATAATGVFALPAR